MLNPGQTAFAQLMVSEAQKSSHIWSNYAAAEACLESAWGASELCQRTKDIFGLKAPSNWTGATINMPTREFLNGTWQVVGSTWPVFDTYSQAFEERMAVLQRVTLYAPALAAANGPDFIAEVSKIWATDPLRGSKVMSIFNAHPEIFGG